MSLGTLRARVYRVSLAAVYVLASMALTAAPSWAAKEETAGAKLCREYPGALFARDGSAFKSTKACVKYAAKGAQLGGVDAVAEPPVNGSFTETCTGFGLAPNTALEASCGATYSNGDSTAQFGPHEANGTWAVTTSIPCTEAGGQVVSLQVVASAPEGPSFEREFPPPSGC